MHPMIKDLQCLSCGQTHDWTPNLFLCTSCGGNLEVRINLPSPAGWLNSAGVGIWRYQPLLPLSGPDGQTPLLVGTTPLLRAPAALARETGLKDLWIKDEARNPSASFKDRASAVALAYGYQQKATHFAGASTGNAGSSMACLAASLGLPCTIFVPAAAPRAKLAQLQLYGARVIKVEGTYDQAFDLCVRVAGAFGWFNRNTGQNPYTREGKKTVSYEIFEQFQGDMPDFIVVPVGDGNIISGVWKGLRELLELGLIKRLPRLVAAQSELSNAVSQAWNRWRSGQSYTEAMQPVTATTIADSISVDLPRDGVAALRAVVETDGLALEVSDREILEAASLMARTSGVFAEPAAATAMAAARKLEAKAQRVLVLSTGSGLKDVDSLMKVAPPASRILPDWTGTEEDLRQLAP